MPEKITDEALLKNILWDEEEGYTTISESIIEQTRWAVLMHNVFQRNSDRKLFMMNWRKAATEMQKHEWPEEADECEAYTESVTKYRRV